VNSGASRLPRRGIGERLAGFVYGTIVTLAVLVAGARAFPEDPAHIAATIGITLVVLWVAHVYAHALAHSVTHDEHLSLAEVRYIARREASLMEAAVPPLAALLLGVVGIFETSTSLWVAFGAGLAVLAVQGLVFARVERLSWAGTAFVVAANLGLGLALVTAKVLLTH
jgi:hypothetical protein